MKVILKLHPFFTDENLKMRFVKAAAMLFKKYFSLLLLH